MGRAVSTSTLQRQALGAQQRRLLCATDLRPRSERAVHAAALLANRLDARLTLLHVVSARPTTRRADSVHEKLTEQLARTASRTCSIPALSVRRGKKPAFAISHVAEEGNADLIILGPQRRRAFAPLLGTTAERVSALASRPVLVVNGDADRRYDGVVVAADLTGTFVDLLALAGEFNFLANGSIAIAHGLESPLRRPLDVEGFDVAQWRYRARKHFRAHLDEAGINEWRSRIIVHEMRPLQVVKRTLREFSRPLLIVGARTHTALSRALRGSLVHDALLTLNCDVLVARR